MAQSLDNKSFATLDAPRRNRFYYGKLLDVFHLEMEQDYGRLMRALSNRHYGRRGGALRPRDKH